MTELRNRVYDFANIPIRHPVRLRQRRTLNADKWDDASRLGLLALTQTSKQLRKECMPLYLEQKKFKVTWGDLPAFLSTFSQRPIVRLDSASIFFNAQKIDILPALQHGQPIECRVLPERRNEILQRACGDLNTLLGFKSDAWVSDLKGGTYRQILVWLRQSYHRIQVKILLNRASRDVTIEERQKFKTYFDKMGILYSVHVVTEDGLYRVYL